MAPFTKRNKKRQDLHKAIFENDTSKIVSLARTRPGLTPGTIGATMMAYHSMKTDLRNKAITPLLVAIQFDDLEIVKYLIKEDPDLNCGNMFNMGPLSLALHHKHYEIATLLIKSGADVNLIDEKGKAPLYHAIQTDSPVSIVDELLSAGAVKDGVICDVTKYRPLTRAIEVENILIVEFLLKKLVDVNLFTNKGLTPLNLAIEKNFLEITKLLVNHGAKLESQEEMVPPPLLIAVQAADVRFVNILIKGGANVNQMIRYEQNMFDINVSSTTILHVAVVVNFLVVPLLLESGANVNATESINNFTPLHMTRFIDESAQVASKRIDYRQMVQLLLENGADVNATCTDGSTVLQDMIKYQHYIVIEECIKFGVNVNSPVSPELPLSIFQFVILKRKVHLVRLCLEFGAEWTITVNGIPPNLDVKYGDPFILKLLVKYSSTAGDCALRLMNSSNYSWISQFLKNEIDLYDGIKRSNYERVRLALERGAAATGCLLGMRHPLHYSAALKNADIVEILLEYGVIPSSLDTKGLTPLHIAARSGDLRICKALLRRGACYDYRGPGGTTPEKSAKDNIGKEGMHRDVVKTLKNVSRCFNMVRKMKVKIIDDLKKILNREAISKDFFCYVNCINRKGNTLMGEALSLGLTDIAQGIMSLR